MLGFLAIVQLICSLVIMVKLYRHSHYGGHHKHKNF